VKIKITQDDIDKGNRHSSISCPLARAINRIRGQGRFLVSVTSNDWRWKDDWHSYWPLPEAAIEFIRAFDAGELVKPMELEL